MTLDPRKEDVLRIIVEEHVSTGLPVGSASVVARASLGVSSATVRNDMAVLERDGYITAPHTSAGRIPTEKAYRHYVATLQGRRDRVVESRVSKFFAHAELDPMALLQATTDLLVEVADYTAMVMAPPVEGSQVAGVHVVPLRPPSLLVLVVTDTGDLVHHPVQLAKEVSDAVVAEADRVLNEHVSGHRLGEPSVVPALDDPEVASVVDAVVGLLDTAMHRPRHIFLSGRAKVAQWGVGGEDVVPGLLRLLDRQAALTQLLAESLSGDDVVVRIGSENRLGELREASVVTAPYASGDERVGSVAVLGPTRMDYARAVAAVQAISERLGPAFRGAGRSPKPPEGPA